MIKYFNNKQKNIEGTREEILELLKKKANPNCNKCYGRGHTGFREVNRKEIKSPRIYISCPKCIDI